MCAAVIGHLLFYYHSFIESDSPVCWLPVSKPVSLIGGFIDHMCADIIGHLLFLFVDPLKIVDISPIEFFF